MSTSKAAATRSNRSDSQGDEENVNVGNNRTSDDVQASRDSSSLNKARSAATAATATEQSDRGLELLQQRLKAEKTVEECIRIEPLAFEEDIIGACVRSF
jgi:hypothetical protein